MIEDKNQNIIPINIEEEMKGAYIDYSMSVIVSRALPDVRDGLKKLFIEEFFMECLKWVLIIIRVLKNQVG